MSWTAYLEVSIVEPEITTLFTTHSKPDFSTFYKAKVWVNFIKGCYREGSDTKYRFQHFIWEV